MVRWFVLVFFLTVAAYAGEVVVTAPRADLYDAPNGKIVGSIGQGKKIKTAEHDRDGHLRLITKSGRSIWIREADVRVLSSDVEEDLESDPEPIEENYAKYTWDLGFSTGSSGGDTYSEANVGLNYFFKRWLAWRNALFGRFIKPENIYGLDSSIRMFYSLGLGEKSSLTIFGGPGYRFVTKGLNVPFAEGGLVTHLGSFTLGVGAKTFFTQMVQSGAEPDTQYFIILAGGGAL